jgi:hypothetical protein
MRTGTAAIIASLGLVACAGSTNVVPTGPDTYMIASRGTMGWSSGPAQKAKAFEEADAYCKQKGRTLETISESDSGAGAFGKVSTGEVRFRCVTSAAPK